MKAILVTILIVCAFPLTLSAESGSYSETSVFTSSSTNGSVESFVETSGNAEVRIRSVINGEIVEDIHLEGENVLSDSEHEVIKTEPLSSEPTTTLVHKTIVSEVELGPEAIEQQSPDSFIKRMSNRNFFFSFFRTDTLLETSEDEKTWSASFISAINQFFAHLF